MNIIEKAIAVYRRESPGGFARRAAGRVMRTLVRTNCAWWYVRETLPEVQVPAPRVQVRLNFDDPGRTIDWIRTAGEQWMYQPREVETGLREGHCFPSIEHDGEIIGYMKIGWGRVYIGDFEREIVLPEHAAFIYDTFVLPQYRGLGIAPHLIAGAVRCARDRGRRMIGCHIPPWNTASMHAYAKSGFKRVRFIRYVRIAGLGVTTADPGGVWR